MFTQRLILALFLTLVLFGGVQAEYVIGIDDVLQVSFWQAPTLDQSVTVNADGKITLTVIGEITAAGLTTAQLSRKIVEQVSRFNRDISQATVTVTEFNSQTVFVEGEVVSPGRYAREVIPDIWTIIKEMGGITPAGDLTQVRLVRGGAVDPGTVLTVDVLAAVRARDFTKLPQVHPRDIIRVPQGIGGVTSDMAATESEDTRDVYYILGAVARPAVYKLESRLDLIEALALAGGTLPDADIKKITVSDKSGAYSNVYKIDLEKQLKTGSPQRYIVQAENAIYVPTRGSSNAWSIVRDIVTFGSTITSTILLIDRLGQDDSGN
ncbi:MAG: polysaccharide biosynthesis/export family protein [Candidatus Zixiibacteriota bacterium]